jgi:hypothetical protein
LFIFILLSTLVVEAQQSDQLQMAEHQLTHPLSSTQGTSAEDFVPRIVSDLDAPHVLEVLAAEVMLSVCVVAVFSHQFVVGGSARHGPCVQPTA